MIGEGMALVDMIR